METLKKIVKYWYVPLLVGIIYITLGIWCLETPIETFITLAFLFSLGFIVSGIMEIAFAVSNRNMSGWAWGLLSGIIDIVLGSILFLRPALSFETLTLFVSFWVLFRSFMSIGNSIELSKIPDSGWGFQLFLAILGVFAGLILLTNPIFTGAYLVIFVASGLILLGIYHIIFSIKIKQVKNFGEDLKEQFKEIEKEL